jgi:hypothetical protein
LPTPRERSMKESPDALYMLSGGNISASAFGE